MTEEAKLLRTEKRSGTSSAGRAIPFPAVVKKTATLYLRLTFFVAICSVSQQHRGDNGCIIIDE
jgi:hypothetical protein